MKQFVIAAIALTVLAVPAVAGDGRGGFTMEWVYLDHGVGGMNSFAVGDVDGDGLADIVTQRYEGGQSESPGFDVLWGREWRSVARSTP